MKNLLLIILAISPLLLGSAANATGNTGSRSFIGLWEAVDPSDGSLTQRSINCDRDGNCSILGSDSFWVVCGSPRGILRGAGFLNGGELRVPEFTLTCTEDQRDLVVDTTFIPDRRNRTLREEHVNPNIPTIIFHRTSR